METPYGEIPDNLVKDMSIPEMHDYLKGRYRRRSVLKGAGILGLAAAAGPILWRQSSAFASTAAAPQWIAYGPDPTTQTYIAWAAGTASGPSPSVPSPHVQWGLDSSYGSTQAASANTVPVPSTVSNEPVENAVYSSTLLSNLTPNTTYHYSVSNDGVNWSADTTFTTAEPGLSNFRFTMVGDEATSNSSTLPIAQSIASFSPRFNVVVGDLSYAGGGQLEAQGTSGFGPSAWDTYLGIIGPAAAQSIPWMVSTGNHEMEPLGSFGYDGFLTRFPYTEAYAPESLTGSPVVKTYTYGNVAIIQLDGNDLSAEIALNNGYTQGKQTTWLQNQLAAYRQAGSGIDWIIVGFHNCMYCSNTEHGSDDGIRSVWEPIFDQYQVDLVVNGHVHAYERSYPIRGGQVTKTVPSGGTTDPTTDGTTYILAGGGGQSLYTGWYGPTGGGDAANASGPPLINTWVDGGTSLGANNGGPNAAEEDIADTVTGYSAFRHANWSFIVLDVTAPTTPGGTTSILVRAIDPTQTSAGVTSISSPAVMDSVTLTKASQSGPAAALPETPNVALLGVAGAAVVGAGIYAAPRPNAKPDPAAEA
jgi:hypothetical protein